MTKIFSLRNSNISFEFLHGNEEHSVLNFMKEPSRQPVHMAVGRALLFNVPLQKVYWQRRVNIAGRQNNVPLVIDRITVS